MTNREFLFHLILLLELLKFLCFFYVGEGPSKQIWLLLVAGELSMIGATYSTCYSNG